MSRDLWTHERIVELVELWGKGWTQTQIGKRWGLEANAVSGAIMRAREKGYKLPRRQRGPRRKWGERRARERAAAEAEKKKRQGAASLPISPCSWPIGHPGGPQFHFCDLPCLEGKSYCADHWAMAHTKSKPALVKKPAPW